MEKFEEVEVLDVIEIESDDKNIVASTLQCSKVNA